MRVIGRLVLAGTLLLGTLTGCGRVLQGAVTALPAFFISEQQEIAIGLQAAREVLAQMPLVQSATLQAYVNQLGTQLVAQSDRQNLPYRFFVVQAKEPNAFALPGGFIFVTSGLLALMENEAQLAGVIGHEIGHVTAKHHIESIRQAALAQGVAVAAVGSESQVTQQIASVVAQVALRGFGRANELESDQLGAKFAAGLGYDPSALTVFLQRLEAASGGAQPGWLYPLSSHPPAAQRVERLNQFISQNGLTGSKTNRDEFLTKIGAQP